MTEALWLLLMTAAVGAGCFYAGWRSALSYLEAAKAISAVTNAVASQSNEFSSTLDKAALESALLKRSVDELSKAVDERSRAVEDALGLLLVGFQRANVIPTSRPGVGRQVGEEGT